MYGIACDKLSMKDQARKHFATVEILPQVYYWNGTFKVRTGLKGPSLIFSPPSYVEYEKARVYTIPLKSYLNESICQ